MAKAKTLKVTEKQVHIAVCQYLDLQYPNVIYSSDASGMRLTMGLRVELQKKTCKHYKVPDLLILHPNSTKNGLFLEIKRSVRDCYKLDGTLLKSEHLEAQQQTIFRLRELGYSADFGCGIDDCIRQITKYLET